MNQYFESVVRDIRELAAWDAYGARMDFAMSWRYGSPLRGVMNTPPDFHSVNSWDDLKSRYIKA